MFVAPSRPTARGRIAALLASLLVVAPVVAFGQQPRPAKAPPQQPGAAQAASPPASSAALPGAPSPGAAPAGSGARPSGSALPADARRPVPDLPGSGNPVLSAREALQRMMRDNLDIVAAKQDLSAMRADVIAAGVLPNPNISLNGEQLIHGVQANGVTSWNIVIDQVVPIGGQVGVRREVAQGLASAAEREFAGTVWTLGRNVRDAYVDLQAVQARWRVLAAGVADLERVEAIITERARAGANPAYDRVRVQLERADLASQLGAATADLSTARVALAQAIGKGVSAETLLADELPDEPPDPPSDLGSLAQLAQQRRHELAAARLRVSAAESRITQVKREYVPSPDFALGYSGWTGVQTDNGLRGGGAIYAGISLPIPLFDRGQGKVDRAASEAAAARTRAEATDVAVRREVERALFAMTSQVGAWRRYRDSTAGQLDSLRLMAETAYREGRGTIMELLDAYRTYLSARQRSIELRANAWRATMDLERAVGPAGPQTATQPSPGLLEASKQP